VCWLVELFTKFSSHQHLALTPLRLEPSFLIPVVTVSCFVKVTVLGAYKLRTTFSVIFNAHAIMLIMSIKVF